MWILVATQMAICSSRQSDHNAGGPECDIIATNGVIHKIDDVINTRHIHRTPDSTSESTYKFLLAEQLLQDYSAIQSA